MAARVNPQIAARMTCQGLYIAGADGRAYGWYNDHRSPAVIQAFLDAGLANFRRHPPAAADIPAEAIRAAARKLVDPSISVLAVFARIRPVPAGCEARNSTLGRDHMWVTRAEVQALLNAECG